MIETRNPFKDSASEFFSSANFLASSLVLKPLIRLSFSPPFEVCHTAHGVSLAEHGLTTNLPAPAYFVVRALLERILVCYTQGQFQLNFLIYQIHPEVQ